MSGTLFVVATPIGNLEDITLRAIRVLREADVIAAEDTRRTAKLLRHYDITTPTLSFHQHNIRTRVPQLIRRLAGGERVAQLPQHVGEVRDILVGEQSAVAVQLLQRAVTEDLADRLAIGLMVIAESQQEDASKKARYHSGPGDQPARRIPFE